MKKVVQLSVLNLVLVSGSLQAAPLVVYGEDNRTEVFEASEDHQKLAKSTAAMISKYEMTTSSLKPGLVQLSQTTLTEWLQSSLKNNKSATAGISFCDGTRFADQPNPGMCSGFLIGPDLLVTAGHCVKMDNMCDEYQWVFDFKVDPNTKKAGVDVKADDIYKCKKVVSDNLSMFLGTDYAVIQLDRKVSGREPLEINSQSKVDDFQSLVVIGNPSGLPTKVAGDAHVRNNSHPNYFSSNLDTFAGNSGSAVFNAETGVVEGILVRGEEDYIPNFEKLCVEVNICSSFGCRGEDVSRISSIPEVKNQKDLYEAAIAGDVEELNSILAKNIWVDFYTKDGQSALIKAAGAAQNEVLKVLIAKGADVNLQDAQGNTALHELAAVLSEENAGALYTLLMAGAKLDMRNQAGETPLMIAARNVNKTASKLLLSMGAN